MILEGERVRLRPASLDDKPAYVRWYTDPEFRRYMGPGYDVLDALGREQPNQINFSVETTDGRLIGLLFITRISTQHRHCDLGVVAIGEREYWDKGYGTEMVLLALRFCFREVRMQQVHIVTAEFNERARRCYGRIFPHEQRHRRWAWHEDRFWDEVYFDIVEEEFDALEAS